MNTAEQQTHSKKSYFAVFGILAVLTIMELTVPYLSIYQAAAATALVLLTLTKASAVALYYMHLKFETKHLKWIAMLPLVTGVYAVVLMLEAIAR